MIRICQRPDCHTIIVITKGATPTLFCHVHESPRLVRDLPDDKSKSRAPRA